MITTQPTNPVTAGDPFGLTFSAADAYGNVVTGFNGPVTIGLFNNPVAGALNGNPTATASNGHGHVLRPLAGHRGVPVTRSRPGHRTEPGGDRRRSTWSPAAASQLVLSVPPPTTMVAGADFGLAILAEDRFGNLATGFTGNVTIALANNPGHTTLIGASPTMAATGGVANFGPHVTIDTAGSGYTLQATSSGLTSVTSGDINVVPAAATHLVVESSATVFRDSGQQLWVGRRRRGPVRQRQSELYRPGPSSRRRPVRGWRWEAPPRSQPVRGWRRSRG